MKRSSSILSTLLFALSVAAAPGAHAQASEPAATAVWNPIHPFFGSWTGVTTAYDPESATERPKITRKYETAETGKHVQVNDRIGKSNWQVAGVISVDAAQGSLVLSHLGTDGRLADLAFKPEQSSDARLVFIGVHDNPGQTRVTYDRLNWNEFVERVEYAPQGQEFSLIRETRFKRKG